MNRKEALSKIGDMAQGLIFGPQVEGVVEKVFGESDGKGNSYWHILVDTNKGRRHFTFPTHQMGYVQGEGFRNVESPYHRGDEIIFRIRGKGMIFLPWSPISRDPFNLKPQNK